MRSRPPFRSCVRRDLRLSTAALVVSCALTTSCATAMSASASLSRTRPLEVSTTISLLVADASRRFAIPERWIAEVMQVESHRRAEVVSPKGAIGLMQVMPGTYAALAARYGLGGDPWNPRDNVMAGTAYLRELYDRYGPIGMLAAYNAGPGRWEDHLSRARPLPQETVRYLAWLGPVVRGSVGPLPAFDNRVAAPMPPIPPIFALLSDTTMPVQNVGEQERIARIVIAKATVVGRPAALFIRRPSETNAPSSVSKGGDRAADGTQPSEQQSRAPKAFAPTSALLFAPRSGTGERP